MKARCGQPISREEPGGTEENPRSAAGGGYNELSPLICGGSSVVPTPSLTSHQPVLRFSPRRAGWKVFDLSAASLRLGKSRQGRFRARGRCRCAFAGFAAQPPPPTAPRPPWQKALPSGRRGRRYPTSQSQPGSRQPPPLGPDGKGRWPFATSADSVLICGSRFRPDRTGGRSPPRGHQFFMPILRLFGRGRCAVLRSAGRRSPPAPDRTGCRRSGAAQRGLHRRSSPACMAALQASRRRRRRSR